MLIKKKAIIDKTKFNRVYLHNESERLCNVCSNSDNGYRSYTNICELCDKVLSISGLNSWSTLYGYIPYFYY